MRHLIFADFSVGSNPMINTTVNAFKDHGRQKQNQIINPIQCSKWQLLSNKLVNKFYVKTLQWARHYHSYTMYFNDGRDTEGRVQNCCPYNGDQGKLFENNLAQDNWYYTDENSILSSCTDLEKVLQAGGTWIHIDCVGGRRQRSARTR